ncbi:Threonine synthase [Chitinispirillum alkaliphilum]|nr:Threonine synthase [Chitinispirillum alkaliphilum]
MRYISTRDNIPAVSAAQAISLGMVPSGGLFVPESVASVFSEELLHTSYQELAFRVLNPLLSDFSHEQIRDCIESAYSSENFDIPQTVGLKNVGSSRYVLELWHGPTAAFKDVALQIMPHFMKCSKEKIGDTSHTLILVATSGDTGKAALEGFIDCEGISIAVFYPHEGVSEIQKLQMVTTGGSNTHVVAVRGNFDDCQNAVKQLFGDESLRNRFSDQNVTLSSANSINWGRLCPQIVYYFKAYLTLVERNEISFGEQIDFSVPTGNFGNILAGFYAKKMGLPVRKLICASNCNNVLTDFFKTGTYNRNREFFRTSSPSMDILISSNLERFLFEIAAHDGSKISDWYDQLSKMGSFTVDTETIKEMGSVIEADWVDESGVLDTIGNIYKESGYLIDTHTAVAAAVAQRRKNDGTAVVIASTASPYKFSGPVLKALGSELGKDEFHSVSMLEDRTGVKIHRAVDGLKEKAVRHDEVIGVDDIAKTVECIVSGV